MNLPKLWGEARQDRSAYFSWTDTEQSVIRSGVKITRQSDGEFRMVVLFRGGEYYAPLSSAEKKHFGESWSAGCKEMAKKLEEIKEKNKTRKNKKHDKAEH